MSFKYNFLFFVCSVFFNIHSYAQDIALTKNLLDTEIEKKSNRYKNQKAFAKAQVAYLNKEWDSTLIFTAKQLNISNNNDDLINYCHFFRGNAFNQKKIFNEAEKEFLKVSESFPFYNLTKMFLGTIASEQKKFEKALSYFIEIENYNSRELQHIDKLNIQENIALCYMGLGKLQEAEPYFKSVIEVQKKKQDTIRLIGTYGNIANLYYERYEDTIAIKYFTKAYELSKKTKDFYSKYTAAANMSVVEENRRQYKLALTYQLEAQRWKDSVNNQSKIYEVAKIEKKLAVEQKQKEVDVLEAENKVKVAQRNGILVSALVLLALLGASVYFYREKVKSNKIITSQNEALDSLNATKDKLFSIVSHDLRSSVNALKTSNRNLVSNLETKNIDKLGGLLNSNSAIVNGAYNLLDNLLNWAMLQTKQTYFNIEEHRLFMLVEHVAFNYQALFAEKNITFINTVSKKGKILADQESLKIILRNLLDNAIKFSDLDGEISVYSSSEEDNYIQLIIEDCGLGMSEATRLELLKETSLLSKKENEDIIGTGLGIQLCKSMIKKNNGKFSIESQLGSGTKMIVSLPKPSIDGQS
ncbi:MAG: sensor histidine kinase [Winogradskyella sp.]|nr:MAG: sensor histidine kinase [Winogradskyella sp.]